MAAILRDSTVAVVVAVMGTRPRAIPLAMITMRKSIYGFPLVSYMGMGFRLVALRAARAPAMKGCYEVLEGILIVLPTDIDVRSVV